MNDYGDDDDEGAVQQTKKLAFVLSQLRDDLDEIVSGLESGGSLTAWQTMLRAYRSGRYSVSSKWA